MKQNWEKNLEDFSTFMESKDFYIVVEKDKYFNSYTNVYVSNAEIDLDSDGNIDFKSSGDIANFPFFEKDYEFLFDNIVFMASEDFTSLERQNQLPEIYEASEEYNRKYYYDKKTPISLETQKEIIHFVERVLMEFFDDEFDAFFEEDDIELNENWRLFSELDELSKEKEYKDSRAYEFLQWKYSKLVSYIVQKLSDSGFDPQDIRNLGEEWWMNTKTDVYTVIEKVKENLSQYNLEVEKGTKNRKEGYRTIEETWEEFEKNDLIKDIEDAIGIGAGYDGYHPLEGVFIDEIDDAVEEMNKRWPDEDMPDEEGVKIIMKHIKPRKEIIERSVSRILEKHRIDPTFFKSLGEDFWGKYEMCQDDISGVVNNQLERYNLINRDLSRYEGKEFMLFENNDIIMSGLSVQDAEKIAKDKIVEKYSPEDVKKYANDRKLTCEDVVDMVNISAFTLMMCSQEIDIKRKTPGYIIKTQ